MDPKSNNELWNVVFSKMFFFNWALLLIACNTTLACYQSPTNSWHECTIATQYNQTRFHSVWPHSDKPRSLELCPLNRIPSGRIPISRCPKSRIPSGRCPLSRIPFSRISLNVVYFCDRYICGCPTTLISLFYLYHNYSHSDHLG